MPYFKNGAPTSNKYAMFKESVKKRTDQSKEVVIHEDAIREVFNPLMEGVLIVSSSYKQFEKWCDNESLEFQIDHKSRAYSVRSMEEHQHYQH